MYVYQCHQLYAYSDSLKSPIITRESLLLELLAISNSTQHDFLDMTLNITTNDIGIMAVIQLVSN